MRFAEFDLDPAAGVLTRDGVRVRLQDLPLRLLVALLRKPGIVVTRDELRQELWGAETFVDAEAGLNTAVGKLREALGDDADTPRFIETVPKRGYRFVGTVIADAPIGSAGSPEVVLPAAVPARPKRAIAAAVVVIATIALAFAGYQGFSTRDRITIAVVRFHNETGTVELDRLAGTLTDAVVVALAQNSKYDVIGNSPLLRTDRIFQDVRRIGEALEADYVVLGQIQRGDTGLLVRAHFIRPADDKHLWASKIDIEGVSDVEQRVTTTVVEGVVTGLNRAAGAK